MVRPSRPSLLAKMPCMSAADLERSSDGAFIVWSMKRVKKVGSATKKSSFGPAGKYLQSGLDIEVQEAGRRDTERLTRVVRKVAVASTGGKTASYWSQNRHS